MLNLGKTVSIGVISAIMIASAPPSTAQSGTDVAALSAEIEKLSNEIKALTASVAALTSAQADGVSGSTLKVFRAADLADIGMDTICAEGADAGCQQAANSICTSLGFRQATKFNYNRAISFEEDGVSDTVPATVKGVLCG